MITGITLRDYVFQLCGGKNRVKGWTGMALLPSGDVRESRNRAKFPRWGN